jgi:probable addiction module antidote protein
MNFIIDVEPVDGFKLALAFKDGFEGIVDLEELFKKEPFNKYQDNFLYFSLENGTLCWGDDLHLSPNYLRSLSKEHKTGHHYIDANNPIEVITKAFQESLEEDDPSILLAALRGYADKLGMSTLVKESGIKSRSSAYKSLSESGSSKWDTIVKLAHTILKLHNTAASATH